MWTSRLPKARVSNMDMLVFTRQLATLTRAGVPLRRSLRLLCDQTAHGALGEPLSRVGKALDRGVSPSVAFAEQSPPFDHFFVSMVAIGEVRGAMYESMERITSYMEKDARVKQRVRAALIYPSFVLILTFLFTLGTFRFLLPGILPMITAIKGELPWITRTLVLAVESINNTRVVVVELLFLAAVSAVCARFMKQATVQPLVERFLLWCPFTRNLFVKVHTCQLAACLGALLEANVPVVEALSHASQTLNSVTYARDLELAADRILSGQSLSEHFESSQDLYTQLMVVMVLIGEKSGQVPSMLYKVAQICDQDIDYAVELMIAMLEPGMMALLAVIVGSIILAIFLPLYGSLQNLM